MGYYKDLLRANLELDKILETTLKNKSELDINLTVYELTKKHPVSGKALKNRIVVYAETHDLKILNNTLKVTE